MSRVTRDTDESAFLVTDARVTAEVHVQGRRGVITLDLNGTLTLERTTLIGTRNDFDDGLSPVTAWIEGFRAMLEGDVIAQPDGTYYSIKFTEEEA